MQASVVRKRLAAARLGIEQDRELSALLQVISPTFDAAEKLSADIDWARLIQLAEDHRVTGTLHLSLAPRHRELPPADWAQLQAMDRLGSIKRLTVQQALADVRGQLDAAGIRFLVMKGPELARRIGLPARHAKDIDILVHPDDFAEAEGLLRGNWSVVADSRGEAWEPETKDITFFHASSQAVLEMHWKPFSSVVPFSPEKHLWTGSRGELTVTPEQEFAMVAYHCAIHGLSRLKWPLDVACFAGRVPLNWQEVREFSLKSRGLIGVGAALAATAALWPEAVSDEALEAVAGSRSVRVACRFVASLPQIEARNHTKGEGHRRFLQVMESPTDQLNYVRQILTRYLKTRRRARQV